MQNKEHLPAFIQTALDTADEAFAKEILAGLPHSKHEAYTYVNTRLLALNELQGLEKSSGTIKLQEKGDAIAKLSLLLSPEAEELNLKNPKVILKNKGENSFNCFHYYAKIEKNASLSLLPEFEGKTFNSVVLHVEIDEGIEFNLDLFTKGHAETVECIKLKADIAKGGKLKLVCASGGSKLTRFQTEIHLNGAEAKTEIYGVSVLDGAKQTHHHLDLNHHAEATESVQRFHSVVLDDSQLSIDGTVTVDQKAQKTDSDQLIKALMLSDNAKVSGKPNLRIFADDVACAHGYTCGELEKEQIFYLESRGLTNAQAKKVLTRSFVEGPIFMCSDKNLAQEIDSFFLQRLPEVL